MIEIGYHVVSHRRDVARGINHIIEINPVNAKGGNRGYIIRFRTVDGIPDYWVVYPYAKWDSGPDFIKFDDKTVTGEELDRFCLNSIMAQEKEKLEDALEAL